MKKLFFYSFSVALLAALLFTSCQKEEVQAEAVIETPFTIDESNYYTPDLSDFEIDLTSRAYWTTIPAGSTDMLQQAVDNADVGGIIYLKAGTHRETGRVTVNKKVNIIGEDGAVLMVASQDTTAEVDPGIHVLNAAGTLIKNVKIEPLEQGSWCGIMFENSPRSAVLSCEIVDFWFGVLIEKSDEMAIMGNQFFNSPGNAILANDGKSCYIADNEFGGTGTAIWACDKWGTIERNDFHDNNSGMLLCNYPEEFGYLTPSGEPLGAPITCTAWKIRNNQFTDNTGQAINIRDGANFNLIESNNDYSGSGKYDIHIPADAYILGGSLFVPTAPNNFIYAAPNILIKDCGINNTISGGTMVDTSVDPC